MKEGLNFHWGNGHLSVDFAFRTESRVRVLLGLEITAVAGIIIAFILRGPGTSNLLFPFLVVCLSILVLIVGARAAHRLTFRERLFMDASHLTLIQTSCFARSVRSYDRASMGPLRYARAGQLMRPDSPGDVLGLSHADRLLESVAQQGNLFFEYKGETVFFGRGVYSWHAEELATFLQLYCGDSLRLGPEWRWMLQEEDADES